MHIFLKQRYITLYGSSWSQLKNKAVLYINPINFDLFRGKKLPNNVYYRVDGIFTTWIFKWIFGLKEISPESFDFSSVAGNVFQLIVAENLVVNIFGGDVSDIDVFLKYLKVRYPSIRIGYSSHGYDSEDEIIEQIKANHADINILGLGSPKQENIAIRLCRSGWGGTIFCCGGLISQTASANGLFYPPFVVSLNIRWIYRIYKRPAHILRFAVYPYFFLKCILLRLREINKNI